MTVFTEAWLAEHQRKIVEYRGAPVESVIARPDKLTFTLPKPTITLNKLLHMHPMVRSKYAKTLSSEVAAAIGWNWLGGHRPWDRVTVTITRRSIQLADTDGATGGTKPLIDTLVKRSERHPWALGVFIDDSPDRMTLIVQQVRVTRRAEVGTDVVVEELAGTVPLKKKRGHRQSGLAEAV